MTLLTFLRPAPSQSSNTGRDPLHTALPCLLRPPQILQFSETHLHGRKVLSDLVGQLLSFQPLGKVLQGERADVVIGNAASQDRGPDGKVPLEPSEPGGIDLGQVMRDR